MGFRVVTAPTCEPVTLAEVRLYLRMPDADHADDDTITQLITAARQHVEGRLRRQIVQATLEYTLDQFPIDERAIVADRPGRISAWQRNGGIRLPCPPLISVTSIKYIDGDGVEQTLSSSVYAYDTNVEPGVVMLAFGQSWPAHRAQADAITITYLAGYGATVSSSVDVVGSGAGHNVLEGTYSYGGTQYGLPLYTTGIAGYLLAWDTTKWQIKNSVVVPGLDPETWNGGTNMDDPSGTYSPDLTTGAVGNAIVTLNTAATDAAKQAAVPAAIKLAIKMLVAHWYDAGRAPVNVGNITSDLSHTLDAILAMQGYGSYYE